MTLLEKLQQRIDAEAAEIVRLTQEATANVAEARRRKGILELVEAKVKAEPDLETLLALLSEAGITVVR